MTVGSGMHAQPARPSMLPAALAYARLGWRVLPLHEVLPSGCSCGREACDRSSGKHPRIARWERDASVEVGAIREWWSRWPNANIGIAAGEDSGLLLLDVDGDEGRHGLAALEAELGELPTAPTVFTSNGEHRYFAHPGVRISNSAGRLAPRVDVRADGGQCVAPPSLHRSGVRYRWAPDRTPRDLAPPPLPPAWIERLERRVPVPAPPHFGAHIDHDGDRTRRYCRAALDSACEELANTPRHHRNDAIMRLIFPVARLIGTRGLDRRELWDAACAAMDRWPQGERDLRKDFDSLGRAIDKGAEDPRALPAREPPRAMRSEASSPDLIDPLGADALPPLPSDEDVGHSGGSGSDARPRIVIRTREDEVNAEALEALVPDPRLFVRGNALVRVVAAGTSSVPDDAVRDPDAPAIDVVPAEILQEWMAASAEWVRLKKDREGNLVEEAAHPPKWCVGAVLKRAEWPSLRRLESVVEVPVLRPDGSVLDRPGYDARTGLLYVQGETRVDPVPERPTATDISDALERLSDIVCDFCFAKPEHKSAWLASVLTPLARYAFRGPSPLFLFDANGPGVGKGLLLEVAVRIATGRAAPLSSFSSDNAEMDKRITTWASSGRLIVALDNVSERLGGDPMCRALTGTTFAGRVLGLTKEWVGPSLMTWYATGNNISLGADMYRRVCHVRLVSPVEDPSTRTGFRYTNLLGELSARQGDLARCALTLLRGYCAAGRPDQKLATWGSYEAWSDLVRGAIVWAGWPDPSVTREELRKSADTHAALHRALVLGWRELVVQKGGPVTVKAAIEYVCRSEGKGPLPHLRSAIEEIASDPTGKPSSRKLGNILRTLREKIFVGDVGPVMLDSPGTDRDGVQRWTVATVGEVPAVPARAIERPDQDPAYPAFSSFLAGSEGTAGSGLTAGEFENEDHEILEGVDETPQSQQTPHVEPDDRSDFRDDLEER